MLDSRWNVREIFFKKMFTFICQKRSLCKDIKISTRPYNFTKSIYLHQFVRYSYFKPSKKALYTVIIFIIFIASIFLFFKIKKKFIKAKDVKYISKSSEIKLSKKSLKQKYHKIGPRRGFKIQERLTRASEVSKEADDYFKQYNDCDSCCISNKTCAKCLDRLVILLDKFQKTEKEIKILPECMDDEDHDEISNVYSSLLLLMEDINYITSCRLCASFDFACQVCLTSKKSMIQHFDKMVLNLESLNKK